MPLDKGDRRPCSVYRWYAATGQLLYVGAALDPNRRWAQLRTAEDWPQFAVRRTVEWHPTVRKALAAETAAIRSENPLLNLDGRGQSTASADRWS